MKEKKGEGTVEELELKLESVSYKILELSPATNSGSKSLV